MSRFALRAGIASDAPALAAICRRVLAGGWSEAALASELERDEQPVIVLSDGGVVAGFAILRAVLDEAELLLIAVAPEAQRAGAATALWRRIEDRCRGEGIHTVHLEVRASNGGARAFYARMGFIESGRRRGYYADPVEDAVLMRWRR